MANTSSFVKGKMQEEESNVDEKPVHFVGYGVIPEESEEEDSDEKGYDPIAFAPIEEQSDEDDDRRRGI